MRFTTAWADTLAQNVTLKVALLFVSIACVALGITAARLGFRAPLIIERGCYSRAVEPISDKRTDTEIEAFVREALLQRFDSNTATIPGFLSEEEELDKKQEQDSLKARGVTQTILIRSINIENGRVQVISYRVLFMGEMGSPLRSPLELTLSTEARTESDPYGLRLMRVSELKGDKK